MSAINESDRFEAHRRASTAVPCRGRLRRCTSGLAGAVPGARQFPLPLPESQRSSACGPRPARHRAIFRPAPSCACLPAEQFESLVKRATEGLRAAARRRASPLAAGSPSCAMGRAILAGRDRARDREVCRRSRWIMCSTPGRRPSLAATARGGAHMGLSELPVHLFAEPAPVADHTSFERSAT